ncbi:MAG: hypothetical protein E7262_01235 [Lachnospiraceae bacterium]|nr:hypothetical protein [Lachnospiraceae bacterium]
MSCVDYIYSNEYVDFIYDYNYREEEIYNRFEPDCVNILSSKYAQVYKKIEDLKTMSINRYGYDSFVKLYTTLDEEVNEEIGIGKLRNIEGFDYTGRDVLIGFVDTGVNYNLDIFKREDGTSKIIGIWDQSIYDEQENSYFDYGRYYTREEINKAINSDEPLDIVKSTDNIGHGTAIASICVGNEDLENGFVGGAPDAEVVVVKLKETKRNIKEYYGVKEDVVCYGNNDIIAGILFLEEIARRENKPLVICLAIGTTQGSHKGRNYLSELIDFLSNSSGIAVVVAGGNEVNTKRHYQGIMNLEENALDNINEDNSYVDRNSITAINMATSTIEEVEITVEGQNQGLVNGFFLEIWTKTPNQLGIGLVSPTGEIIPMVNYNNNNSEEINFIFDKTTVYIDYVNGVANSGDSLVFVRFKNPSVGIWKLVLYKKVLVNGGYNIWLPTIKLVNDTITFVKSEPNMTLVSEGNTQNGITVSGYNYNNGGIYVNSSRGYTADDKIKPDISAPAVDITTINNRGNYVKLSGTSMAAAITVAAVTMLFEWADYVILMKQ